MRVDRATATDLPHLAALRRAWTESTEDPGFEQRFAEWYERESRRRVSWLAWAGEQPVGMLTMAEIERMPTPDRPPSRWGYVSNVFVLAGHRNRGVGRLLVDAVIAHARAEGHDRLVLHPSERSIPFYRRAGFRTADELLLLPL